MAHFDRMQRLASSLAGRHIAIFAHSIDLLGFGSFVCEVGTRHRRWRFTWDGRDRILGIAEATLSDSQDRPHWSPEQLHQFEDADGAFRFIEAFEFFPA